MSRVLRKLTKRWLAARGFRLAHAADVILPAVQFRSTITAFEHLLNSVWDAKIPEGNEKRMDLLPGLLGTCIPEAYFIVRALAATRDVAGDVCEFGVAQGATSAFMANEILAGHKRLHLFDSFAGLPKPDEKDALKDDIFNLGSMEAYAGTMACPGEMVMSRLREISFPVERYMIHKGFIEHVLATDANLPSQVSFAYVDLDLYKPIRIVLEYLDLLLPAGGIIIVDDYDFFSTGVKTAVDEFLSGAGRSLRYTRMIPDRAFGAFAVLQRT